jgi:hypothetical protein
MKKQAERAMKLENLGRRQIEQDSSRPQAEGERFLNCEFRKK